MIKFKFSELKDAGLDRKISLCEELLEILDVLYPGYTRARGELLLELQSAMTIKTKRDLAADKITKEAAEVYIISQFTVYLRFITDQHNIRNFIF